MEVIKKTAGIRFVSLFVSVVFMWTNCVYASGFSDIGINSPTEYKLSASSQIAQAGVLMRNIEIPAAVLNEITERKITKLSALIANGKEIKEAIIAKFIQKQRIGEITIERLAEIISSINDSCIFLSANTRGTAVIYLFNNKEPFLYRIAPVGVSVGDEFFKAFLKATDRIGEIVVIDGKVLEVYKISEGEGAARCLKVAYGEEVMLPSAAPAAVENDKQQKSGGQLTREHVLGISLLMSFHAALLFPEIIDRVFAAFGLSLIHLNPVSNIVFFISGFVIMFLTAYISIGWHERGHFMEAVSQITLNDKALLKESQQKLKEGLLERILWNLQMLIKIPLGKFKGINANIELRDLTLSYSVASPYNLAVAAAGPRASRNLALFLLPFTIVFMALGFVTGIEWFLYIGRLFMGLSVVGFLDYKLADKGEYRKYLKSMETVKPKKESNVSKWIDMVKEVKERMRNTRLQEVTTPGGRRIRAPWGYRNCAMGGAHTQKEYPESNISLQEAMFIPLSVESYEDAQRMTVELQNRLKQIIDRTPGCRVMGIGLEGGLATYITKDPGDKVPEQKMWRLMKQAIDELGYQPGIDVAIALDPAASELQNEYNKETYGEVKKDKWEIGKYNFWRYTDEEVTLTRQELLVLYESAIQEGIPIVSIEDGFAEDDYEGWRLILERYGDKLFIIGDDLVTTNDETIEKCIDLGLINTALIKANQIGTLSETLLAMLVVLGHGMDLVISHRSKSPNDDMEAQIALAAEAMGLKAGGGANTERLVKYGAIIKLMKDVIREQLAQEKGIPVDNVFEGEVDGLMQKVVITGITAYEEATNAGIPTVGVKVTAGIPGSKKYEKLLVFTGATPLGTSAGTGEAIHLIDSTIERSEVTDRYPDLFAEQGDGTYKFKKGSVENVQKINDPALTGLWIQAQRYEGKGCQNAVRNVEEVLSKLFVGKEVSELGNIGTIDRMLMEEELKVAIQRGKISPIAGIHEKIRFMQRKGNLGMNAILSLSLALARLIGAINGKDLSEVLREEMSEIIAKTIENNGGLDLITGVLPNEKITEIRNITDKPLNKVLVEKLSWDELVKGLQALTKKVKGEGKQLHKVLRAVFTVYGEMPPVSAPVARKAGDSAQVDIWEADLRDGRLGDARVLNETLSKGLAITKIQAVLDEIRGARGEGITSGVDVIRIADNLNEGGVSGVVPYSMIKKEGMKRVLLVDKDALADNNLLYLVLDHELTEGIMTLIPYEGEAIRELTSNFMSIKIALGRGIREVTGVSSLDPDNRFFEIVRYIQEEGITEDKDIIALLIEHMRATPYYKGLFSQFSFAGDWEERVRDACDRFRSALEVFNEIEEAKAIAAKVKETAESAITTTDRFTAMIRKVKMIVSQLSVKQIGLVESLLGQGKYIRLDVEELEKNPELILWLEELLKGKDSSPFIFYGKDDTGVSAFLDRHPDLRQGDIEGKKVAVIDNVTLIDPAKVTADMPRDTLYLPLPYAKSTVYLAVEVVGAGGNVDGIDALARNTIRSLYEALIGEDVSDGMLGQLFTRPWEVLPPITQITATLNAIRIAIADIEMSA